MFSIESLPISKYKNHILDSIKNNDALVICGITGCGKSIGTPLFLYEQGYNVIVTVPRKVAAVSLANTVAQILNSPVGDIVGFKTGEEKKYSRRTKILFCTEGTELNTILQTTYTNTVICIDEFHERTQYSDCIAALIKKKKNEGDIIKTIIMSATIDIEKVSSYFDNCPIIEIKTKMFPVVEHSIESIYDIDNIVVNAVIQNQNILIFRPGLFEIGETHKQIEEICYRNKLNAKIIDFHGQNYDIDACLQNYNMSKIIIATNVAETSLTIPDLDIVIDDGIKKILIVEEGIEKLVITTASLASCEQRRGRVGRTKKGIYYLVKAERPNYDIPEIKRILLSKFILTLYKNNIDVRTLHFLDEIPEEKIDSTIQLLKDLKALKENNELTSLGDIMTNIPVDIAYAKMFVVASNTNCYFPVAIIVSMLIQSKDIRIINKVGWKQLSKETTCDGLGLLDIWIFLTKEFNKLKEEYDDRKYIKEKMDEILDKYGINKRNFWAARNKFYKELVDLINDEEYNEEDILNGKFDRNAIRLALAYGYSNFVCKDSYNIKTRKFIMVSDKGFCYNDYRKYIVGKPIIIERPGGKNLHILTNAIQITEEELAEINDIE